MDQREVRPEEIISKLPRIEDIENSDIEWLNQLVAKSNNTQTLEDKENDRIIEMRERWANWVLILIGLIIGFDIVLVWMYGMGIWSFKDSTVVIVVISENFLKIFGLGFLITSRIFDKIFKFSNGNSLN